jgi:hypothetical protein
MTNEACAGCDQEPAAGEQHPWVAVMNHADIEALPNEALHEADAFGSVPVCEACHQDPGHRKRALKAHFFPRAMARRATVLAGSDDIG